MRRNTNLHAYDPAPEPEIVFDAEVVNADPRPWPNVANNYNAQQPGGRKGTDILAMLADFAACMNNPGMARLRMELAARDERDQARK